jgi:hypothetical protein
MDSRNMYDLISDTNELGVIVIKSCLDSRKYMPFFAYNLPDFAYFLRGGSFEFWLTSMIDVEMYMKR